MVIGTETRWRFSRHGPFLTNSRLVMFGMLPWAQNTVNALLWRMAEVLAGAMGRSTETAFLGKVSRAWLYAQANRLGYPQTRPLSTLADSRFLRTWSAPHGATPSAHSGPGIRSDLGVPKAMHGRVSIHGLDGCSPVWLHRPGNHRSG